MKIGTLVQWKVVETLTKVQNKQQEIRPRIQERKFPSSIGTFCGVLFYSATINFLKQTKEKSELLPRNIFHTNSKGFIVVESLHFMQSLDYFENLIVENLIVENLCFAVLFFIFVWDFRLSLKNLQLREDTLKKANRIYVQLAGKFQGYENMNPRHKDYYPSNKNKCHLKCN